MAETTETTDAVQESPFDIRPAAVEAWIADLPVANLGETSRRLYTALVDLNGQSLSPKKRVAVLEQLSTHVHYADEALKKHFVGQSFPLKPVNYQVARLARALSIQFAMGYQTAAYEQLGKSGFHKDQTFAQAALFKAIDLFGLTLLRTYQVYAPYPRGLWQRLHKLYLTAESHGLDSLPMEKGRSATEKTIADAYKQLLLFALACPYRLRQNETEQVYGFLGNWAGTCSLSKLDDTEDRHGIFITDLDGDLPPSYWVLQHEDYRRENSRLLDTTALAGSMHDYLAQLEKQQKRSGIKSTLIRESTLQRLMLAWGVMPKRQFARTRQHSSAYVAAGLSAAHYFISGEVVFARTVTDANGAQTQGNSLENYHHLFEARSHFDSKPLTTRTAAVRDVWQIGGERPSDADHDHLGTIDYTKPVKDMSVIPEFANYRTHEWKMVDISAGGYRFLWDRPESSYAQVGELLGIREASDPDTFHLALGVIRWMQCGHKTGMELGVEMLAPGAVAAAIKLLKPDGNCGQYMRALLVPAIKTINQPATLLTPTVPYRTGDTVIVNIQGKETRAELNKLVENTGCFAQFQFTSADKTQGPHTESDPAEAAPEDFDPLWGAI